MAGTYLTLELPGCVVDGPRLARSVLVFAERFQLAGIGPLRWPSMHGLDAEAWLLAECEPGDLGLGVDDALDVVFSDMSLKQALRAWPLSAWCGLCFDLDIPPSVDGPEIWGSCRWRLWHRGGWRHDLTLEYSTSSVGRADSWEPWVAGLVADAQAHFSGVLRAGE